MDALPVTLGSEFEAYTTALTVARDGIMSAKKELEKVALGGTAVGTVLIHQRVIEILQLGN